MTADHLDRTVGVEDGVGSIVASQIAGYHLDVRSATLVIEDPTFFQRVATMLPDVVMAGTVGTVAVMLWLVSKSLRDGELFTLENVRRLKSCANTALAGRAEIFRRGAALRDDVEGLV